MFKICDPVLGFIRFDELEKKVIDSFAFQRLRYIRQMGVAYLLFPGATHTRFEHSLGVMELATRLFDSLLLSRNLPEKLFSLLNSKEEISYYRRVLRLAALCHDLGHLPFSYTAEKEILGHAGHEMMTEKILKSEIFSSIFQEFDINSSQLLEDVIKLISSDHGNAPLNAFERILSQIIVDDHFGADRIDYLLRDAMQTGVGFGQLDYLQLIDTLRLLPTDGEMAIGLAESGLQAVESLWMARYLMYSRVYHHSRARIYSKHMARFMKNYFAKKEDPFSLPSFLDETDFTVLADMQKAAKAHDFDAKVLLKQQSSFVPLKLSEKEKESLSHLEDLLKERFKEDLFIDFIPGEKRRTHLLLMLDNKEIVSASEHSFFLREHPSLVPYVRLYANPNRLSEIQTYLSELKSSG